MKHAVGDARWFQWVTDLDERLDRPLLDAKLDFVNTYCAELLGLDNENDNALLTRRVHSVERFFDSVRLNAPGCSR